MMSEQQNTFQQHTAWLNCICRICGQKAKKLVHKQNFKDELLLVCNIDVENEDDDVMPSKICCKHASVFYKYRKAKENGKSYSASITVCSFQRHSKDICPCMESADHLYSTPSTLQMQEHAINLYEQDNDSNCPLTDAFKQVPYNKKSESLKNFVQHLNTTEKKYLMSVILNSEETEITGDIETIQESFKSLEDIRNINLKEYLSDRNDFVKSVLGMLTKCNSSDDDNYDKCSMSVLLEHVYKLRNSQFIGPVSLLQNMTIFSLSHSRTVADIIGNISAGGKYTTLCKWLDNNAKSPAPVSGDAIYIFDNEQVVGKTWNVKPNNKAKCSVITNIAVAGLNETVSIQAKKDLHPKEWFCEQRLLETVDKLLMEDDDQVQSFKQTHLSQLKLFINAAIEQVVIEQKEHSKEDDIDDIVKKFISAHKFKVCPRCKVLFDKTKRKCPVCKLNNLFTFQTQMNRMKI